MPDNTGANDHETTPDPWYKVTRVDPNTEGKEIYKTDPNGNELGRSGKNIAGVLMILVTIFIVITIIAHWPDKMPPANTKAETKYRYKWFAMSYLGTDGVGSETQTFKISYSSLQKKDSPVVAHTGTDTSSTDTTVSVKVEVADDEVKDGSQKEQTDTAGKKQLISVVTACNAKCSIDLNTLILLLVAFAGFLGNMIHIASSFTNFVGAGKFKRSWMLWYVVKPFTASALAVGVYIIFRAGFLNSAEATANVNLYGVVGIALLAGLYTDMATQKLKEVFGVIFQSSVVRPNPLELPPLKITSIFPPVLILDTETEIVLSGSGFDNRVIKIKINDEELTGALIKPNAISFKYKATKDNPDIILYDEKGTEIGKCALKTAPASAEAATPPFSIAAIEPGTIPADAASDISIKGTGLDTALLIVKVGDNIISDNLITKTAGALTFSYEAAAAGSIIVKVFDDKNNLLKEQGIAIA